MERRSKTANALNSCDFPPSVRTWDVAVAVTSVMCVPVVGVEVVIVRVSLGGMRFFVAILCSYERLITSVAMLESV